MNFGYLLAQQLLVCCAFGCMYDDVDDYPTFHIVIDSVCEWSCPIFAEILRLAAEVGNWCGCGESG